MVGELAELFGQQRWPHPRGPGDQSDQQASQQAGGDDEDGGIGPLAQAEGLRKDAPDEVGAVAEGEEEGEEEQRSQDAHRRR